MDSLKYRTDTNDTDIVKFYSCCAPVHRADVILAVAEIFNLLWEPNADTMFVLELPN